MSLKTANVLDVKLGSEVEIRAPKTTPSRPKRGLEIVNEVKLTSILKTSLKEGENRQGMKIMGWVLLRVLLIK